MAFAHVWGNFILSRSFRKNPLPDQMDYRGFHLHYRTTISCREGCIPAIIRIYQSPEIPALREETVAFVFGKFKAPRFGVFEIEAVNLFPYPGSAEKLLSFPDFSPRFTVVGHVVSRATTAKDGTRLFPVNTVAYIRDDMQVSTIMASISPSKQWPIGPPVPPAQSPVHITGPLDGIDRNTRMPVLTVEDITFDVGDRCIAELINEARLANNYQDLLDGNVVGDSDEREDMLEEFWENAEEDSDEEVMRHEFDASKSHVYSKSKASLSSVPPYPNPLPLPLRPIPWPEVPTRQVRSYPPFGIKPPVDLYARWADSEHTSNETVSSDHMSVLDSECDKSSKVTGDIEMDVATNGCGRHSIENAFETADINQPMIYLEDIKVPQDDPTRYKKKAMDTKLMRKSYAKAKKLSKQRRKPGESDPIRGGSQTLFKWAKRANKKEGRIKPLQGRETE